MKRFLAVTAILALAGCASVAPRPASPVPKGGGHEKVASTPAAGPSAVAREADPSPVPSGPPAPSIDTVEPPAAPSRPLEDDPAPSGAGQRVVIESTPSGATVVVNGRPAGRTPFTLTIESTARGFFRDEQAIRVRFIATQASETSATIEEVFSQTDRIPVRVLFTPEGARRIW